MGKWGLNLCAGPGLRKAFASFGLLLLLNPTASSQTKSAGIKQATGKTFRWIHPSTDPKLWQQIRHAFQEDLAPDEPNGRDPLDVYQYKFLDKVGVVDHSALVVLGHRPGKVVSPEGWWDTYHSAFNYDLATGRKSVIEGAERFWIWKYTGLANLGPSRIPDVTFLYFTCTECEADEVFASLEYVESESVWRRRSWGDGKEIWWAVGEGLVVGSNLSASEDILSFECVHGVMSAHPNGFQDVVARCREVSLKDEGKSEIEDVTLVYSMTDGQWKRHQIRDAKEIIQLTAEACSADSDSILCKLPLYLTAPPLPDVALEKMFPGAPKTVRDLKVFRTLKPSMSMAEVVQRCGRPDEVRGSGRTILLYYLYDGERIVIGGSGAGGRIRYLNLIKDTGKVTPLIAAK